MCRFQPEAAAAQKLGIPLATFRQWVKDRRLPSALPDLNLYDMKAIDAALDQWSGIGTQVDHYFRYRQEKSRGTR